VLVDSAIQVNPLPVDFDVGFIHAPRAANWTRESLPSFFEFGHLGLRPPQQRCMRDRDSTFGHHFREITIRELIRDVLPYAQDDELLREVTALKERIGIAWRTHDWRGASRVADQTVLSYASSSGLHQNPQPR
jgi:hypothetical protein